MTPLLVVAAPVVLVILGMMLNGIGLSFDQPASSAEQDPAKRLDAERRAFRSFFDAQRNQALKRQKRVGQYSWLVLIAFIASSWWLYFDTTDKTAASNQIAAIQTVPVAEGKELVLSLTLRDGKNVKYLIKSDGAGTPEGAKKAGFSKEAVPTWEISRLGTALSVGDKPLPLGIALTIAN